MFDINTINKKIPANYSIGKEKIFNVDYLHIKMANEDDLYITKYGIPFIDNLWPENHLNDRGWFNENSWRLSGSSCIYKVRTKNVKKRNLDLVIKWNRMGQDVPGSCETDEMISAEFNSPFEEFSLVMELRDTRYESSGKIITQKPLAIFVPAEKISLSRIGRKDYKMKYLIHHHDEVDLDMYRNYVVIYEWIKGIDAAEACDRKIISEEEMIGLTLDADREMIRKGFFVKDRKPQHIIIRQKEGGRIVKKKNGDILYGLVDFELLLRTSEREEKVRKEKRLSYLKKQKDRFDTKQDRTIPAHLKLVEILGVNYIYGHAESTDGKLWVVGKDPDLFDYFLPERWENTPRTKLSQYSNTYYTLTKDNINLVWKVSKVGTLPDKDPFKKDERAILDYGYNSPFEEISLAIEISRKGIRTVYPRAIYMFGQKVNISDSILDKRRYESHRDLYTPDGDRILRADRTYILIFGYWNGPDEKLADKDSDYLEGINALRAYREGIISHREYVRLLKRKRKKLSRIGIRDLNMRGRNLMLSLDSEKNLVMDEKGFPETRICNFELLKRI